MKRRCSVKRGCSGGDSAETNERVAERIDLTADVLLSPPIRLAAIPPRRRPALAVDPPLTVAPIEDHLDVGLAGKLARKVAVQVQLLSRHDEEMLTHECLVSEATAGRQLVAGASAFRRNCARHQRPAFDCRRMQDVGRIADVETSSSQRRLRASWIRSASSANVGEGYERGPTAAVAQDDYDSVRRSPVASGCRTSMAYPTSRRSPSHPGFDVSASM